jgi:hypothetical protein
VLHVLDTALDQSHEVKAEVEACADDLASANDVVKAQMADGATELPAAQALHNGRAVELRVQGCADDLQQVTDNLAHGVAEVKAVEQALDRSRAALLESEAALAASRTPSAPPASWPCMTRRPACRTARCSMTGWHRPWRAPNAMAGCSR